MRRLILACILGAIIIPATASAREDIISRMNARAQGNLIVDGALTVSGGLTITTLTGAGGETLDNATDDMWEFQGVAGTDNTDLRLDLDGTYPVLDSPTDTSIGIAEALVVTEGVTLGGGYGSTGCTLSTAGVVQCDGAMTSGGSITATNTFTGAAATTYDAGGAAQITIGSADVTQIVFSTDGTADVDVQLGTGVVGSGEILDGTIVCADTDDGSGADGVVCEDTAAVFTSAITLNASSTFGNGSADVLLFETSSPGDGLFTDSPVLRLRGRADAAGAGAETTYDCDIWSDVTTDAGARNVVIDCDGGADEFSLTSAGALTLAGTVTSGGTFTGAGATTYDATGAAQITIGSADVTQIVFSTDGVADVDVQLGTGVVGSGEILDGTLVCADTDDGAGADGVACEDGALAWTGIQSWAAAATFNGGVTAGDAVADTVLLETVAPGDGLFSDSSSLTLRIRHDPAGAGAEATVDCVLFQDATSDAGAGAVVFDCGGGADELTIDNATGNVTILGDLVITGDDFAATTNTIGAVWVGDGAGYNPVVMGGEATIAANGALTIANDAVDLTTQTAGNYVATLADDGQATVTVVNGAAEGGAATLRVIDVVCTDCLGATELADVASADLAAEDFGDFTCSGAGAGCTLNANVVDGAELADNIGLVGAQTVTGLAAEILTFLRTLTSGAAESGVVITATAADPAAATTEQYALEVGNAASTEGVDALVMLQNEDADDAVVAAIMISDAGGGYTYDFLDDDDASFLFGRPADGNVAFTCRDEATTATWLTCDPDGADADAQVQLPTGSVGSGEIVDGTIVAGDIADRTVTIQLPITSWQGCGSADDLLNFDDVADAFPDYTRGSGGATAGSLAIEWDVTGGSIDNEPVCAQITVPQDYVSGLVVYVTLLDTGTNDHEYEILSLVQSPDSPEDVTTAVPTLGLGAGASTTTTVCDGATTASDLYTCTLTIEAAAAGSIVTVSFGSDGTSTESTVMMGAEARYTANQ